MCVGCRTVHFQNVWFWLEMNFCWFRFLKSVAFQFPVRFLHTCAYQNSCAILLSDFVCLGDWDHFAQTPIFAATIVTTTLAWPFQAFFAFSLLSINLRHLAFRTVQKFSRVTFERFFDSLSALVSSETKPLVDLPEVRQFDL